MDDSQTAISDVSDEQAPAMGSSSAPAFSLQLGINECDNKTYHADRNYLSSSLLKTINKSLAQYHREYILGEKPEMKPSAALEEGSLAHTLILEPHMFSSDYIKYPGFDKREKDYAKFKAAIPTSDKRTIISAAQLSKVKAWVQSYKLHPTASSYIEGGIPEQTICALLNDVPIKVRFDSINVEQGFIADVKTTRDPGGLEFFKACALSDMYSYHLSAALYLAVAEQFYGKPFDFYFIVLSKQDVTCEVYKLSAATRAIGKSLVNKALEKYKQALATGVWTDEATAIRAASSAEVQEI